MSVSVLLICRTSPWSGLAAKEALDIALAGGAFDLPISMLWLDEGVWQLVAEQQPQQLEQKNLQAQLSALPMFGVEKLYVAQHSLEQRGLTQADLALEVEAVSTAQIAQLIQQHQQVLNV